MNDIEQKALALLNEVAEERMNLLAGHIDREITSHEALFRAIEQHEAFRQEVSDAVEVVVEVFKHEVEFPALERFIIPKPKPDPLARAVSEANAAGGEMTGQWIADFRAALDAAGFEIREKTLRQFLFDNFGWDIYDWEIDDIRF